MSIHPQIAELAGYIAQSRPEPERAPYVQSIRQRLTVGEGQTPLTKNLAWRRELFSVVFRDVKGLGEGAERGCVPFFFSIRMRSLLIDLVTEIEGFFNLLYSHLLTLWPIDSPETKSRVSDLLPIITYSTAESATKYRVCVSRPALSPYA